MEMALLAFDGLDPRVVHQHRDELPNFHDLMLESQHGSWKTPGHTIPSFTATLTGREYKQYNFHWDKDKGSYKKHRQTGFEYLWEVLDSSVSLLNIPVLFPPEDIEDCMVCGFLTPDSAVGTDLARPVELQNWLNGLEYIHDVPADKLFSEMGGDSMLTYLEEMMEIRAEAARYIIDEYDSDLFYGVWTATDRWGHQAKKHELEYLPVYEKADQILGEMLEVIPEDIPLIVFSDHGFVHQEHEEGVHKGHRRDGYYCLRYPTVDPHRDDSLNIMDLYPTILSYLEGKPAPKNPGRIMFYSEEDEQSVKDRLSDLGYLE